MKKKILFAASTRGHVQHFHTAYIRALNEQGAVIHGAWAGESDAVGEMEKVWVLPFEKRMTAVGNFKAAAMLRRIIREEGYDAVIVHTSLAAFFVRLAILGLKNRPKCINMVHGYLFDDDTALLKKAVLLAAEKLTAPVTDLLLAMNRWDFETARRHRLGKRVEFIPGIGVDFAGLESGDRAGLRQQLGIEADDFVLIYPAEFSRRKNQSFLLRLMPALPDKVVLVLPGRGDMLDDCKALARELGLGRRTIFPGYVNGMGRWYDMADAAVSSSRSEGLPFNIMEAMYFGLPVVASNVKGHCDLVSPGENGLLYPYGDQSACVEAISRLAQDNKLCRGLGEKAREKAFELSRDKVLPQVMEKYKSILH